MPCAPCHLNMMERFYCPECNRTDSIHPILWRCRCGSPLDLLFSPQFSKEKILQRDTNLWRYREALPIKEDRLIVSMGEGMTPLEKMTFEDKTVWVKIDYLFPTGSYKDRGATVLISKVRELGIQKVVEDSSGNAGAAIAAYCAKAGIRCDIYVPQSTSPEKLIQIRMYGARLERVEGSREKTASVTMEAAQKVYYASHCWNPYFLQGTKTFAFEVWEQMDWKAPDTVVLPVGHGTLLLGAYLGFKELQEAKKIKKMPKLIGIQSSACAPIYLGWMKGFISPSAIERKETMAEGIAIAEPVRGKQILKAIRDTEGEVLTVTEREIKSALQEMGRRGHFIEPTAAATVAGMKKYLKKKGRNEIVVATLTGTGLKSAEKMAHLITHWNK